MNILSKLKDLIEEFDYFILLGFLVLILTITFIVSLIPLLIENNGNLYNVVYSVEITEPNKPYIIKIYSSDSNLIIQHSN